MTPFYERDGITIYHGDAIEVMRSLPNFRPGVMITDPPYGETALRWDIRLDGWAAEVYRVAADSASLWCFGSFRMFYEGESFKPWQLAQDIVWEKHNGSCPLNDRFRRVHELVVHFYRGTWSELFKSPIYTRDATKKTVRRKTKPEQWNPMGTSPVFHSTDGGPRMARSVQAFRSCHGVAVHPTQKPVELISLLVEYSARPDDVVFDPFMGSGSTLVAARAMGRRAVGVDSSLEYCQAAVARLAQSVLVPAWSPEEQAEQLTMEAI